MKKSFVNHKEELKNKFELKFINLFSLCYQLFIVY